MGQKEDPSEPEVTSKVGKIAKVAGFRFACTNNFSTSSEIKVLPIN